MRRPGRMLFTAIAALSLSLCIAAVIAAIVSGGRAYVRVTKLSAGVMVTELRRGQFQCFYPMIPHRPVASSYSFVVNENSRPYEWDSHWSVQPGRISIYF